MYRVVMVLGSNQAPCQVGTQPTVRWAFRRPRESAAGWG